MKKSQLNAISYAYARRERERIAEELDALRLNEAFELQSIYKTPRGFLAAWKRKSKTALSAIYEAYQKQYQKWWSAKENFSSALHPVREKELIKILRIYNAFNELRIEIYPEKGKKGAKNEK